MIPQIIMMTMIAIGVGIHLAKHGEQINMKYNFFFKLVSATISVWILYEGGFWNVFLNN
tara:strand:- start:45 stop:221 length:177 start_codon:yes stop_codon:yes gene_type:complete